MNYGVYARPNSPYWWIYWYRGPKDRVQESSKKRRTDPLGWKQAYDMAKAKARDSSSIVRSGSALWDTWVDDWLRSRLPNARQARSLKMVLRQWQFLRAYLGKQGVDAPEGVTYQIAQDYLAWRRVNRRHPERPRVQTATIEVRLLMRIMREAVKRGLCFKDPLAGMELVAPEPKEKPEIMADEEEIIRQELRRREGHLPLPERWMTISFEIAIRHGWRISETSFPLSRINFSTWRVLVHQKGDRWRTVPVHPELREMFTALRAAGAKMSCVFPKGGAQAASRGWCFMLRGSPRPKDNLVGILPHLSFHCCRVTVISRLLRAGIPERLVMEYVGHASTAVHRIYQRVRDDDLEKCIVPSGGTISLGPPPSGTPQTGASDGASL